MTLQEVGGENLVMLKDHPDAERRYHSLWLLVYAAPLEHVDAPVEQKKHLLNLIKDDYQTFTREYGDAVRDYSRTPGGHVPEDDWIQWDGAPKRWRFFLDIPWYGTSMGRKLLQLEAQLP